MILGMVPLLTYKVFSPVQLVGGEKGPYSHDVLPSILQNNIYPHKVN